MKCHCGRGAVAGGDDSVDGRVQQAIGHPVAEPVAPFEMRQVNLITKKTFHLKALSLVN